VLAEIFGMDGMIIVVVIAVVLFGGSQIPKLARSLGSAQREFKNGLREAEAEAVPAANTVNGAPVVDLPVTTIATAPRS